MPTKDTAARQTSGGESPEDRERALAFRRSAERERERKSGTATPRNDRVGHADPTAAARAFAALAENVRDYAIFLMNTSGVITFWGEGARLIKWWTKDEAEGAHLRLLYPSGGSEDGTAEDHLRSAAERGEYTGEGQRIRSDGSTFWAGITITALWDDDGTLLGFAKVTRDLTARRAADALLQAAAASAESARADAVAASAAKSSFLATMSHEIRTPVNAVLGYLELLDLEIDGPLSPAQRRHLARTGASARHLLKLITEVLDFSRIDANRMTVPRAVFRVGDAVTAAIDMVAPQAHAHGLEIADVVSGFAAGLAAWGDESSVRQILINLLGNAVKFTHPPEGEVGRITVSAGTTAQPTPESRLSGNGPWIYVRVEDTGMGIPANRTQEIFEPFVQADMTLTRTHGGTGLGLAISRRLARLMDGDVTLRTEEGMGSTFFLWLPAAPVESLNTGGLQGPQSEPPAVLSTARSGPLRAVADALLGDMERVLHAYVARLRSDPGAPSAHRMEEAQVEDHLASFVADLASTLTNLSGLVRDPNAAVEDGTAIQRVVAERHGKNRARLRWTEDEIRREFVILREELTAAVRRRAARHIDAPTSDERHAQVERALDVLSQFLTIAEKVSVESYRQAMGARATAGDRTPS